MRVPLSTQIVEDVIAAERLDVEKTFSDAATEGALAVSDAGRAGSAAAVLRGPPGELHRSAAGSRTRRVAGACDADSIVPADLLGFEDAERFGLTRIRRPIAGPRGVGWALR
jgi:hypothetical protein